MLTPERGGPEEPSEVLLHYVLSPGFQGSYAEGRCIANAQLFAQHRRERSGHGWKVQTKAIERGHDMKSFLFDF